MDELVGLAAPGWLLILGAPLVLFLPRRLMQILLLLLPAIGLVQVLTMPMGTVWVAEAYGYSLMPIRADELARVFAVVFHIAAFLSMLFALHLRDRRQHAAALIYAGSAIAALYAGDLVTLFVYWELTAVSSVVLVWARERPRAFRAGVRYLVIQVLSGVVLMAGALYQLRESGSLDFVPMDLGSTAGMLLFIAFGIKAAFPLLHNWLQDAYPEATPTGAVFLSAFTTKLAIYALARGFAGTEILIPIGAAMTAFPIFFAVVENDLRRVLAYSLNNQLGYMVVGIGIGTELALNGAAAHAFAHILYKGLLFMSMGAVLRRAGTCLGSELGGLYKAMPRTTIFCMVGAASISAFPLTSGFVAKGMILAAAAEEHHTITFLILLFASAGVFHHSGIKIPYFAFFAHDNGARHRLVTDKTPRNMLLAMAIAAFLCIAIGAVPGPLYSLLPYPVDFHPYTTSHVITQLQLLLYSALAFVFLQKTGLYPPELRSTVLDTDWSYRKAAPWLLGQIGHGIETVLARGRELVVGSHTRTLSFVRRLHTPGGRLGDPWPTGLTVFVAALLLAAYLVLYYL